MKKKLHKHATIFFLCILGFGSSATLVSCLPPDYVADFNYRIVPWQPLSVQVSLTHPTSFTITYPSDTNFGDYPSSPFSANFDGTVGMDFSTVIRIPGHIITPHMTSPTTGTVDLTTPFSTGETASAYFNTTTNIYIPHNYSNQGYYYAYGSHPESRAHFTVSSMLITIGP